MFLRCSFAIVVALGLIAPTRAATCTLVSSAKPMLAAGLAEPLGDMVLRCSSGDPNSAVQGLLLLGIDVPLANLIGEEQVAGLSISVDNGIQVTPIPGLTFTTSNGKDFLIQGLTANFDATGSLTLRLSGMRAAATTLINGTLVFVGSPGLSIAPQAVPLGYQVDSFYATNPDALLQPNSAGLKDLDPKQALAGMRPNLAARITESAPAAFHPKLGADNSGTRLKVQFLGLPAGSRLFAPDVIAGLDADAPTRSGFFDTLPATGGYVLGTPPDEALLLVRVSAAAADGSGGQLAWQPQSGVNSLAGVAVNEADYLADGSPYFLYEVVESSPALRQSAEIPIYAFAGATESNGVIAVRAALQLAPVPVSSTTAALPVPRYTANDIVRPDCTVLLDCTAKWAPELRVQSNSTASRRLPVNSGSVQGFVVLTDVGGDAALWKASVQYAHGPEGWLILGLTSGFVDDQIALTYLLAPSSLKPGAYHANVVFTLTNAPDGSTPTVSQPVELIVVPHPAIQR